jgi:hypothetical protein
MLLLKLEGNQNYIDAFFEAFEANSKGTVKWHLRYFANSLQGRWS